MKTVYEKDSSGNLVKAGYLLSDGEYQKPLQAGDGITIDESNKIKINIEIVEHNTPSVKLTNDSGSWVEEDTEFTKANGYSFVSARIEGSLSNNIGAEITSFFWNPNNGHIEIFINYYNKKESSSSFSILYGIITFLHIIK